MQKIWRDFYEENFFAAIFAISLIFGNSTTTLAANAFNDVPAAHWAYSAINQLISEQIINPDVYFIGKNFSGDDNITRYDVALMLGNLTINNYDVEISNTNSFSDVPNNHPAQKAVELLSNYKIMEGYGDGTFRGNKNMTRIELALILSKFLDKIGVNNIPADAQFSDIPTGHWAYSAVSKIASARIMEGYGDGTFRGDRNIKRFELALIIAKINNKYVK